MMKRDANNDHRCVCQDLEVPLMALVDSCREVTFNLPMTHARLSISEEKPPRSESVRVRATPVVIVQHDLSAYDHEIDNNI